MPRGCCCLRRAVQALLSETGVGGLLDLKGTPGIDRKELAGAVVLVTSKEKVLSLESVGFSDVRRKTPMNTDALLRIASMTYPIAALRLLL